MEQELALPAWSGQLRLVHLSQTCWAGSQERKKALQGPKLTEPAICRPAEHPLPTRPLCTGYHVRCLAGKRSGCWCRRVVGAKGTVEVGQPGPQALHLLVETGKDT